MREIKFRAFVRYLKTILDVDIIDFDNKTIKYIYNPSDKIGGTSEKKSLLNKFHFSDVDLMQYTGLDATDGTKIYEGYILKFGSYKESKANRSIRDRWVVEFDSGSFVASLIGDNIFISHILGSIKGEINIIGNIYENPNLLERLHR